MSYAFREMRGTLKKINQKINANKKFVFYFEYNFIKYCNYMGPK